MLEKSDIANRLKSAAMPAHPRYTQLEQTLADATKREMKKRKVD